MPRSPEDQRAARKARYAEYRALCEDYSTLIQEPWDKHFQQLRAQRLLDDTLRDAGRRDRVPMTAEQRALVGAEWCVTCGEDCLPLPPHGICGFCSRIPATGALIGTREAAA